MELDRQRYEAQLEQVASQVASAKAAVKKAEADYTRVKDLFSKNLTSQAELDAAEATREAAVSQLDQSLAYLRRVAAIWRKPGEFIDGTVTKLNKEKGEIAVGSQFSADVIMNIADLSLMETVVEIDENEVVLVSLGDSARIEVDAIQDTTFKGIVTEIAHTATTRNEGTQEQITNFEVKVRVISDVARLRPGMSATVDIGTDTHKGVLYVPIQCVTARAVKADSAESVKGKQRHKDKEAVRRVKSKSAAAGEVFVVEKQHRQTDASENRDQRRQSYRNHLGSERGQKVVSNSLQRRCQASQRRRSDQGEEGDAVQRGRQGQKAS